MTSPGEAAPVTVPDVTVIIPVYNTMPYLTACLDSLVTQSIGPERLEVVAVDDGSTDGSGEELERYAVGHPDVFTVVHQQNSGGPAAPCNRGLDLATGRYVFFLGADDYLGQQALERMVDRADEWGSDVLMGKMVGVGGRGVSQQLFSRNEPDLPFPHSRLPFTLANTKLFRRSLIEDRKIRYGLDLRVGSDQPFAIEAMLHARRISVLADDTYYYAVRRENAGNISFSSGWKARLEDIGTVMHHVADLVEPGSDRDRILHRHFSWEINNRLRPDFLTLPDDDQRELCLIVARLADAYLTAGVSRRLRVSARLRIRLAQHGHLDELRDVLEFERDERRAPLVLSGTEVHLAFPGYGELPSEWFASTVENLRGRSADATHPTTVRWDAASLVLTGTADLHPDSTNPVRAVLVPVRRRAGVLPPRRMPISDEPEPLSSPVELEPDRDGDGSAFTARLDVTPLLDAPAGPRRRWAVRIRFDAGERMMDLPAVGVEGVDGRVRRGLDFHDVHAATTREGRLFVTRNPVRRGEGLRDAAKRRLRRT